MLTVVEQLNFFDATALDEMVHPKSTPTRKKTMQQLYGFHISFISRKCKDCKYYFISEYSRNRYKCALVGLSHSTTNDIRINTAACRKFELIAD